MGITRARDYLVFPTKQRPTKWLNRVSNQGKEDHPSIEINDFQTPWEWNGKFIEKVNEQSIFARDIPSTLHQEIEVHDLPPPQGKTPHDSYWIDPKKLGYTLPYKAQITGKQTYNLSYHVPKIGNIASFYKALAALTLATDNATDATTLNALAAAHLQRYEVEELVDANAFSNHIQAWNNWLHSNPSFHTIKKCQPIHHQYHHQHFKSNIDFLLEGEKQIQFIQNIYGKGDEKQIRRKSKEHYDWAFLTKRALEACFPAKSISCAFHFVLQGEIYTIDIKEEQLALF